MLLTMHLPFLNFNFLNPNNKTKHQPPPKMNTAHGNKGSYSIVQQVQAQTEQEEKQPLTAAGDHVDSKTSSKKSVTWSESEAMSSSSSSSSSFDEHNDHGTTYCDDQATTTTLKLYHLRRSNLLLSIALSIVSFLLLVCLTLLWVHPSAGTPGEPLEISDPSNPRANSGPNPATYGRGCGSSIAQAKTRNCRFDILSKAWLPQDCTPYGNEEYLRDSWSWKNDSSVGNVGWGIWADRWQTKELTIDELAAYADSGLKWYGTEREHLVHCAWGLKRVLDAYWYGKKLDFVIQQLHHTTHCVDRLYMSAIKADGLDIVLGKGNIRFGHC